MDVGRIVRMRLHHQRLAAAATQPSAAAGPPGLALQAYDEYVIGYKESRDVLNRAGLPVVLPNENTTVHLITVDGQLVALWRPETGRAGITVHAQPLRRLSARERRHVADAFARYATFTGRPVHVELP